MGAETRHRGLQPQRRGPPLIGRYGSLPVPSSSISSVPSFYSSISLILVLYFSYSIFLYLSLRGLKFNPAEFASISLFCP